MQGYEALIATAIGERRETVQVQYDGGDAMKRFEGPIRSKESTQHQI